MESRSKSKEVCPPPFDSGKSSHANIIAGQRKKKELICKTYQTRSK